MKIASLVPSATETLFALGLGERVVAVTHECDYPPAAARLPQLTRSAIPAGLSAGEIDRAVRERVERGEPLYELDEELLVRLEPDLIVTQAVCEVCAVSPDQVIRAALRVPSEPDVVALEATTLGEALADVRRLAEKADALPAAEKLLGDAVARLDRVRDAVASAPRRRVLALEWLAPPFVAGHWVPAMIELAGGEDVLGYEGERSAETTWEAAAAAQPEVVVVMPCGYDADGALAEAERHRERLAALGAEAIWAVDANGCFSRPGPRLVDGVELLGHLLHPDLVPAPAEARSLPLEA
mgnify:CR=1 FL=1